MDFEQRFGRRELEDLAVLIEPVEAELAHLEEPRLQALRAPVPVVLRLGQLLGGDARLGGAVALLRALRLAGLFFLVRLVRPNQRKQNVGAQSFGFAHLGRKRQKPVGHFVHGILLHLGAALRAIGLPGAGKQQTQIIVNFRGGRDRRARIAAGVALLDGDGGRDAADLVGVGLLHALQELPGVGRERLHIAALALRV